jgi:catechol 2,3-dioxygenase
MLEKHGETVTKSIHPATSMGAVHLTVANLHRSLSYYQDSIGLSLLRREGDVAHLGVGDRELVVLTEKAGARIGRGVTGLYHFALLLPSRMELARSFHHLFNSGTPFTGFADHAVSEAMYLPDPDGHGIEIYRDRPRDEWSYDDGQLRMTMDRFDADGVLAELGGADPEWKGLHPQTVMGHMHLHVSDLNAAKRFYVDVLGFELVTRYGPSAMFVAAGGYHHHVGLNTWAGVGAPPPRPEALGLQWFEIQLPDSAAIGPVIQRAESANLTIAEEEPGFFLTDPSANRVLLSAIS